MKLMYQLESDIKSVNRFGRDEKLTEININ